MANQVVSYMINGTRFDIPIQYKPIRLIGQGAYGVVISALHEPSGKKVAIKKITNAFSNDVDMRRNLREIKLLRHFNHENIISILDIFPPPSKNFDDIYIVNKLMDTDLHMILSSPQPLNQEHVQYFLYQILCGLKYVHSANVLHRDLKPSNLLCNEDCHLAIADFGLARVMSDTKLGMTEYVATRWYRAPEVILSWKKYSKAIDIWSAGCILAEMMLRKPIFQGKDYIHQIIIITDILGTPLEEDLIGCSDQAIRFIKSMGTKPKIPWKKIVPGYDDNAYDLLGKMLTFSPEKRITAVQALAHPYFEGLHDERDEPGCASVFQFDFESMEVSKTMYQELIWKEMLSFHPEVEERNPEVLHQNDILKMDLPVDNLKIYAKEEEAEFSDDAMAITPQWDDGKMVWN